MSTPGVARCAAKDDTPGVVAVKKSPVKSDVTGTNVSVEKSAVTSAVADSSKVVVKNAWARVVVEGNASKVEAEARLEEAEARLEAELNEREMNEKKERKEACDAASTASNSDSGHESGKDDKSTADKTEIPKIFDNKNFVEAPLPKTNPWMKKPQTQPVPSVATPVKTVPDAPPDVIEEKSPTVAPVQLKIVNTPPEVPAPTSVTSSSIPRMKGEKSDSEFIDSASWPTLDEVKEPVVATKKSAVTTPLSPTVEKSPVLSGDSDGPGEHVEHPKDWTSDSNDELNGDEMNEDDSGKENIDNSNDEGSRTPRKKKKVPTATLR